MPPKTVATAEQVASELELKKANVREYKDPHAVKHPGVNKSIEKITPDWQLDVPYKGVSSDETN